MLETNFKPIPIEADTTFTTWLQNTNYTTKQKEQFKKILDDRAYLKNGDLRCKSFVKSETYPEFKYQRVIKSRSDRFKAIMGPIFQLINDQLFSQTKYFIKTIPVADRPQWLRDIFSGFEHFDCTDYSSFEAHFINCVTIAIECVMYEWMLQNKDEKQWFMDIIYKSIALPNICDFKLFNVVCSSRASGEMSTSSGNGFTNLMLYTYTARIKGAIDFAAQFEGDDSINSTLPRSSAPTTQDFTDLGWVCKLFSVDKFNEASFCGLVADEQDLINVCDIKNYLVDFGWSSSKYVNSKQSVLLCLLRAKAYSAIYQYPSCPIIEALGHYALRVTNKHFIDKKMRKLVSEGKFFDTYKREIVQKAIDSRLPDRKPIPSRTRDLVFKLQNITVEEQIQIEHYLDNLNTLQPLQIKLDFPKLWEQTWVDYVSCKDFSNTISTDHVTQNINIIKGLSPNSEIH